jgi:predicted AAA+ superfamily ATPase
MQAPRLPRKQSPPRTAFGAVEADLRRFPAVTLLGPRQCGKTTLAQMLAEAPRARGEAVTFLDLERPSDLARLRDPEAFLRRHAANLVCIDEVQRQPGLFPLLRALIDEDRRPGRFLLMGSASPSLLRQSSETLAGRVAQHELTPFTCGEVLPSQHADLASLWLRGGFPDSLLASDDETSFRWREEYVRTFLERDIPQLGFRVPASVLGRFWQMCAHLQGQVQNLSALGRSMGTTHTAARHYLDMLEETLVLRILPPLERNLGKRLVKSPKMYLRDSGLLHAILALDSMDALSGHPVFGASWEGFVVEQVLVAASPSRWRASYYRTATGDELDLVLEAPATQRRRPRRLGIECKASTAPEVTRGFWTALRDLQIDEAYIVAPVESAYPIDHGVEVVPLPDLLERL